MSHTLAPLTVLVLDDRTESRYVFVTWLQRSGFSVIEASTGHEALELLGHQHVDVALLDVNLPDMSGFEVCEQIRSNDATALLPVIHLSATAVSSTDRSEGLLRGADAYLTEPINPADLLATITALIRRVDLRRRAQLTSRRLRHLNNATADVHAASDDARLFEAAVCGAARMANGEATLVQRSDRALNVLHVDDGGNLTRRSVPLDLVSRILEPSAAGVTIIETDLPAIVDGAHVGVIFVDETGEPAGAILIPNSVEDAREQVVPLLAQLSIAIALARANIEALNVEHRIAVVLQQSLLPQEPPQVSGLDIAFRYLAASPEVEIGGDFYEAFLLDDGTIAIAIGDVVGHSLRAATVMGEIRHAIRNYALDGYDPRAVLDRVNRLIRRFHRDMFTSALHGRIDLVENTFTFCNAGHLPFLRAQPERPAHYVTEHDTLLGVGDSPPTQLTTIAFAPGDRLVLVTDGLIESRHEPLDASLTRLRTATELHRSRPDLDDMIDSIIGEVGPAHPTDDIAVLGASRPPTGS